MPLTRWLDALYPPNCNLCSTPLRDGRYLCECCREGLPRVGKPFCIQCGEPLFGALPDDVLCAQCRGESFSYEFARAAALARDQASELIHAFKYGRQIHLHRELALLAKEVWDDPRIASQTDPPWTLVPVPLHWRRQQWRTFNQSREIARTLAAELKLPFAPVLRRIRHTDQQTLLDRTERLKNLRGAFRLSRREQRAKSLRNKPVLLVDDVFTTGSTAEECARVLREEGDVEKVVVLTVLRG